MSEKPEKKILTMEEMMDEKNGQDIIFNQLSLLTDTINKMSFKIQHLEILSQSLVEILKKHDIITVEELQAEIEDTTTEYVKNLKEAQQKARPSTIITNTGTVKTS